MNKLLNVFFDKIKCENIITSINETSGVYKCISETYCFNTESYSYMVAMVSSYSKSYLSLSCSHIREPNNYAFETSLFRGVVSLESIEYMVDIFFKNESNIIV